MQLDANKSYALLWSGGNDSTLILAMLREQSQDFAIVQYRQFWTKEQAKKVDNLIKKLDLKVFSWPMASSTMMGQGDELSIAFELALGNGMLPIVQDIVEGTRCLHESGVMTMTKVPFQFDVCFVGSRKEDTHYSLSNVVPAKEWEQNGIHFIAPLYDYTREQVKAELRARGFDDTDATDVEDTGHAIFCTKCVRPSKTGFVECPKSQTEIPVIDWSPEGNLKIFRQIYG